MTSLEHDLARLLHGFPAPIAGLARDLVRAMQTIRPELLTKVQFGWRSVNFRHPQAGFLCAVFPYEDRVTLIFEHGRMLSNESSLLQGDGTRVRYISFVPGDELPVDEIAMLLAEAVALRG